MTMSELKEDEMAQWLKLYIFVSLVIGIVAGIKYLRRIGRDNLLNITSIQQKFAQAQEAKGHLQIETYGDRTVYHHKNRKGEAATDTIRSIKRAVEKYPRTWISFVFATAMISTAVSWPKDTLSYLLEKMRSLKPPS